MSRSRLLIVLVFAFAQSAFAAATLPDTPLGRIAGELVTAINSGAEDPLHAFVDRWMSASAYRRESADSYFRIFRKFQEQSGGIDVLDVSPPDANRPMSLLVKTRRGGLFARVSLGLDDREPDKLAGMGINRAEGPTATRAQHFPSKKLSEKQMVAAIRSEIDRRAKDENFSGVVLIGHNDDILLQEARGLADREANIANRVDTKFHLASVGKMFTAVAIAQLVKAGKLSFYDTVAKVLPDYPKAEIAKKVTVHDLLTHTAGFGTFFESPGYVFAKNYRTSIEEIEVYRDEPLFFEPATRWRYSNAGYSLLGAIVERISGVEFGEYLRRNIFQPLGMQDTAEDWRRQRAPAVATFYTEADDDPLGLDPLKADPSFKDRRRTGFGDGYSNVRDLFRFTRAYRTGELLGRDTLPIMIGSKVDQDGKGSTYYAYGITERTINGQVVRGHTGGGRADVEIVWDPGYMVIILKNATPPSASSFANEILEFITKQVAVRERS